MMFSVPDWVGFVFSGVLGAIIGSFLNACIHRIPRGIRLSFPRRSFCPSCQHPLPWYFNIPVLSFLFLRGKCGFCGASISPRYLLVEVITCSAFVGAWWFFGWPLAPVYWLLLALLIASTFIDLEHLIIPDEFTWGGMVAGFFCALALPALFHTQSRWEAAGASLLGAAVGFFLLWGVVEAGKLAFGRKRIDLGGVEPFRWKRSGETASLTIGEEELHWHDVFSRASDRLILECPRLEGPGKSRENVELTFTYDRCEVAGESFPLDDLDEFRGTVRVLTIPREAMGFGDVKFLGAIGAFLGWQAVLFTIFAASIIGCLVGVFAMIKHRNRGGTVIPFGPFLALGAVLWIFGGNRFWEWYFRFF